MQNFWFNVSACLNGTPQTLSSAYGNTPLSHTFQEFPGSGKVNLTIDLYSTIIVSWHSSLGHLDVARVNEGAFNVTCHAHVESAVEWAMPAFTPQL